MQSVDPLDVPVVAKNETVALAMEAAAVIKTLESEPAFDLISFLMDHRRVAIQFALMVAVPVSFFAFELGRHFHR
jgi:hypothetical protein